MSISRRQFILGTAAGFILPSYFDKIFTYFENTGEALLEIPGDAEIELIADYDLGGCDSYELNLGNPHVEPPQMTLREYAIRYFGSEEEWLECNGYEDDDFDRTILIASWIFGKSSTPGNAKIAHTREHTDCWRVSISVLNSAAKMP
jgi:hypothetical protein